MGGEDMKISSFATAIKHDLEKAPSRTPSGKNPLTGEVFCLWLHDPFPMTICHHFSTRFRNSGPLLGPDTIATGVAPELIRFSWSTSAIGTLAGSGDLIRPATREEGDEVLRMLLLAFSMDSDWNDGFSRVETWVRDAVARLFNDEEPLCLVIPKGNRLVAASLLDPSPGADIHLVSGPSVLMEYRNRGIGTRLLHASLDALRERGLPTVTGLTRRKSVGARHVYQKFGGVAEPAALPKKTEEAKA